MVVPLIFWTALRLGRPVTILSILLLSAITITLTVRGEGILFPGPSPNHSLVYLQIIHRDRHRNGPLRERSHIRAQIDSTRALNKPSKIARSASSRACGKRMIFSRLRCTSCRVPWPVCETFSTCFAPTRRLSRIPVPDQLAEEMEAAADTMHVHVQELLRTQRLEARIEESEPAIEDLGALLDECLRVQRQTAVGKDIAIDLRVPGDPVRVVTRARKPCCMFSATFSPTRSNSLPREEESICAFPRLGKIARYEVQDSGPGVPSGTARPNLQEIPAQ